jgi:DNA-binding MarR family transcriptional regulator
MERRGHARRIANPRDGRSYLVVLTADGLRAHAEAHGTFEVAHRAFVAELADGEAAAQRELAKLLAAAERTAHELALAETRHRA